MMALSTTQAADIGADGTPFCWPFHHADGRHWRRRNALLLALFIAQAADIILGKANSGGSHSDSYR